MRAAWLFVVAGCTSGPPTSEISAIVNATAEPGRLLLELSLNDHAEHYRISGDEQLRARFRDQEIEMADGGRYQGGYTCVFRFDGDVAGGEVATIVLDRGDERVTIPAAAPDDFMIDTPASTPAAQPVVVTWSPVSTDPMSWYADAACSGNEYADGPIPVDTGMLEIPPGVLSPSTRTSMCQVPLDLTRTRSASPDTGLIVTFAEFSRTHTTMVEVTP